MKQSIWLVLLAAVLTACALVESTAEIDATETRPVEKEPLATQDPLEKPSQEEAITPEPSPTPVPTPIPARFEAGLDPERPRFLPTILSDEWVLGATSFNLSASSGGSIPTRGLLEAGIVPLSSGDGLLNAVSDEVVFLPFPVTIQADGGTELTYLPEYSSPGVSAYVDEGGVVQKKMIIRLPNSGTIVAGVRVNDEEEGAVYAVSLDPEGQILGEANLVFDADSQIGTKIFKGNVTITVDGVYQEIDYKEGKWVEGLLSWEIVEKEVDGDKWIDKVVQFSNGEEYQLLGDDAFVKNDTLMVLDEATGEWEETAPIYTMEELREMAPSEEEMIAFLQSDEIIRSTTDRKVNPLGVGPEEYNQYFGYTGRTMESIIWGPNYLVWLDLADGSRFLANVLPVVTTAGRENLDNPEYMFILLGEERVDFVSPISNADQEIPSVRKQAGHFRSYLINIEEITNVFHRGKQVRTSFSYGSWDESSEQEFEDLAKNDERIWVRYLTKRTYGAEVSSTLRRLNEGRSVEPGSLVALWIQSYLTSTTLDGINLTKP